MVDGVQSEVLEAARLRGGDEEKRAELADALAKLDKAIDDVKHNPLLTDKQIKDLLDKLNGARGGSAAHIMDAIQAVVSATPAAASDAGYEMVSNAEMAHDYSDLIYAKNLEIETEAGRQRYASLIAGKDQPKEVVDAIAYDLQHDPELKKAAQTFAKDSTEVREIKAKNHEASIEATTKISKDLASQAPAELKEALAHLADATDKTSVWAHVRGCHKTVEALEKYKSDHNAQALLEVINAEQKKFEGRRAIVEKRENELGHANAHSTAVAVASKEYDFEAIAEQPRDNITKMLKQAMMTSATAQEEIGDWKDLNTGTTAQRADAYAKAYTEQHKDKTIDQAELRKVAEKYVETHKAQTEVLSSKDLITIAMRGGMDAMRKGDLAEANRYIDQVVMIMQTPGSGYTAENAYVAKTLLTEGAQQIQSAYNNEGFMGMAGVGRDQLLAVINDPAKSQKLIDIAIEDITHSTPDHLLRNALVQARTYGAEQLGINTSLASFALNTANTVSDAASATVDAASSAVATAGNAAASTWNSVSSSVSSGVASVFGTAETTAPAQVAAAKPAPTAAEQQQAAAKAQQDLEALEVKLGLDPHQKHTLAEVMKAMIGHGVQGDAGKTANSELAAKSQTLTLPNNKTVAAVSVPNH